MGFCDEAREAHVRQLVIVDIGVGIVGIDIAVRCVWSPTARHAALGVFIALADEAHGHRRDVPVVVDVSEALLDGAFVGAKLGDAHHLGDDALSAAVVGKLLGGVVVNLVVGRDDEVFAAYRAGLRPALHPGFVVDGGQAVEVEDVVAQDGVPIGRTEAVVAEVPVATLKTDVDVHVAVYCQFSGDWIVLYRTESEVDDVDAAQLLRLGHTEGVFGKQGVGVVSLKVFIDRQRRVVLALAA